MALIVGIVGLLAFELFFAHRGESEVSLRRAADWSVWATAVGVRAMVPDVLPARTASIVAGVRLLERIAPPLHAAA